jgi:transcriptional regulator with XRE-family HTH domain
LEDVSHHAVGSRLRDFRLRRRLTLAEVASAAHISASHLSMIERDRSSASISVLRRITQTLGISLARLFDTDETLSPEPLRRADRPRLESEPGANKYLVSPPPLQAYEVYVGEFEVGASTGDHDYVHGDSQELLIVTEGAVELYLAGVTHRLDEGDSIEFRSSMPHKISNLAVGVSKIVWVISPPTE